MVRDCPGGARRRPLRRPERHRRRHHHLRCTLPSGVDDRWTPSEGGGGSGVLVATGGCLMLRERGGRQLHRQLWRAIAVIGGIATVEDSELLRGKTYRVTNLTPPASGGCIRGGRLTSAGRCDAHAHAERECIAGEADEANASAILSGPPQEKRRPLRRVAVARARQRRRPRRRRRRHRRPPRRKRGALRRAAQRRRVRRGGHLRLERERTDRLVWLLSSKRASRRRPRMTRAAAKGGEKGGGGGEPAPCPPGSPGCKHARTFWRSRADALRVGSRSTSRNATSAGSRADAPPADGSTMHGVQAVPGSSLGVGEWDEGRGAWNPT